MPCALRYIIVLLVLLSSCSYFKKGNKEQGAPIARVYDKYLYQSDVEGVGKGAAKPEDSIAAVKNYIDSWIRHNLILRYAQENLPEKNDDLEKQLQDYKESLTVFLYEKELIRRKLDTTVSDQAISDYYNKYKDNFELKTGLVKMRYVMVPKTVNVKLDSVKKWIKNGPTDFSRAKLQNFCDANATKYNIADSTWFSMDDVNKMLPLEDNGLQNAPFSKSFQQMDDSAYNYMVSFNEYKFKGASAPLSYVRKDIVNLILNKRKLDYVSQVHNSIYNDALENKKFEIY